MTDRLRVLAVIDGLGTGGAERSLAEMLPGLAEAGIDPVVACFYDRRGVGDGLAAAGVDIRRGPQRGTLRRARWLRRVVRDERPDLVHATLLQSNLAARLAAARTGVPVLSSLVNTPYEPVRRRDPNLRPGVLPVIRAVDGWTARHLTAHFHAITGAVRDAAVRDLGVPAERITVIERGRDAERLGRWSPERRRQARALLGLTEHQPVVVAVGRQEYQKGHDVLLAALPPLLAAHPDLVVMIGGRAGHATGDLIRQQEALGLGDHIRFLGFRDDLPEVLAAADVFAFPSRFEGLGGSVIEAMALGLPVVASDLPALREVVEVGANALLSPVDDAEALARAIGDLLADADRRHALGRRSRQRFEERFTLDRSTAKMADLYRHIVRR
jgi:glycosyltransferase involved in cell wall biosynthesis